MIRRVWCVWLSIQFDCQEKERAKTMSRSGWTGRVGKQKPVTAGKSSDRQHPCLPGCVSLFETLFPLPPHPSIQQSDDLRGAEESSASRCLNRNRFGCVSFANLFIFFSTSPFTSAKKEMFLRLSTSRNVKRIRSGIWHTQRCGGNSTISKLFCRTGSVIGCKEVFLFLMDFVNSIENTRRRFIRWSLVSKFQSVFREWEGKYLC